MPTTVKHQKSDNKIAQVMYATFSVDEIYLAAARGMGMDSRCESVDGIPKEISEEYFVRNIANKIKGFERSRIESYQKECNRVCKEYLERHGTHYEVERGMTETEYYANWYFSSIWYRN